MQPSAADARRKRSNVNAPLLNCNSNFLRFSERQSAGVRPSDVRDPDHRGRRQELAEARLAGHCLVIFVEKSTKLVEKSMKLVQNWTFLLGSVDDFSQIINSFYSSAIFCWLNHFRWVLNRRFWFLLPVRSFHSFFIFPLRIFLFRIFHFFEWSSVETSFNLVV